LSEQKLVEPSESRPLLPKQPEVNIGSSGHVDHGKCVAWDECTLLDGVPVSGAEIMRKVRLTGKLLALSDGGQTFEIAQNEVVSIDRNLEPVKARSFFFVQDYTGPMISVRMRTGRRLRVTPEHPLLTNRRGVLTWTKADQIRIGDHVSFLSRVPLPEDASFPDPRPKMSEKYELVTEADYRRLHEITSGFQNYASLGMDEFEKVRILVGLPATAFAARARLDLKTWRRLVSGKAELTSTYRQRAGRALTGLNPQVLKPGEFLAVPREGNKRRIRKLRDVELDEDLVKWFAFVWSEGGSGASFVDVTQEVQMEMLREYLGITTRKFGQPYTSYEGGVYRTYGQAFIDYLRFKFDFHPGNKSESPISDWVCRLPSRLKATFLRWFLTLDGEFHRGQIAVSQANDRNVLILSYLLQSFGIITRFSGVTRQIKGGSKTYSRLVVSGRRNLELFAENIGFEDPRLQAKLRSYLEEAKVPSKETDLSIPVDALSLRKLLTGVGIIREAFDRTPGNARAKDATWYKAYEGALRTGRISRAKLLDVMESVQRRLDTIEDSTSRLSHENGRLREHLSLIAMPLQTAANELGISQKKFARMLEKGNSQERVALVEFVQRKTIELVEEMTPQFEQLRLLATSPLEFDRVLSVEEEDYSGKIYDLTVPEHHNFIAGKGAIVAHNTSVIQAITGVWASAHSEELKRGITIKVGYADAAFYRCPQDHGVASYSTSPKCPIDGKKTTLLRAVSFVDCPGHESLMTNMLAGAFLMDGALLVIAANETVPKPQTREHLQALQMLGMKKIVIAQNKVDLVSDADAERNYSQIEKFVKGTVAEDAPIIPISAQQRLNIDALIEALEEVVPTPKRDASASPLMYVVRSFDVNRPGAEIPSLSGGVLGGSLTKGELKVGDEVELKPGMADERSGKFVPIITKVSSLQTGAGPTDKVGPGGLVAVGTHLDPTFIKGDQMVGSVIGKPGSLPGTLEHVTLDVILLETAVGAAELVKVEKVKPGETVRLNLGTASSQAVATSVRGDTVELDLKKPVAIEMGMRAAMSRRIAERWRLIGSGVLK